jgi:hypothetical protein
VIAPSGKSPVCSVTRLRDNPIPLDYRSYIVMGVMGAIFALCLTASLYDAFILPNIYSDQPLSFALTCLRCFSSYTIIGEIMSTKMSKKPGQIPQLNCMRFFAMCFVIYGHTSMSYLSFNLFTFLVIALTLTSWNLFDLLDVGLIQYY